MQKIYCYVDETGQDHKSEVFIVVTIVSDEDQDTLRKKLLDIEHSTRIGLRKWHKSRPRQRIDYLAAVIERGIAKGDAFVGVYQKPIPYFLPMLEVIEYAIKQKAKGAYRVIVYVDGIDRKKAAELTNALRVRGITLEMVRSRRDESEPLIRLADRFAGCIRKARLGGAEEKQLFIKAEEDQCIVEITKNPRERD